MRFVLPALVWLVAACSASSKAPEDSAPLAVAVTRNPSVAVPATATYELVAGAVKLPDDPNFDPAKIDGMVRASLMVGLDRRGYQLANAGAAQLRVGYAVVHGDVLDDLDMTRMFGVSPGWRGAGQETYKKGTIIVLITDGQSRYAIWRGAIQGQVHRELSDKVRRERIGEAVEMLLDRLR